MKRGRVIIGVAVVFVAAAAWAARPRAELVDYSSPPIKVKGVTYRATGKVPAGWILKKYEPDGGVILVPSKPTWIPTWMQLFVVREPRAESQLIFTLIVPETVPAETKVCWNKIGMPGGDWPSSATRVVKEPDAAVCYYSNDHAQFERTHVKVCSSFRVEKVGE